MTSVAGYVEKCYACGISGADKDMETCFTTPSSSRIQNCSEILPIEWRDKWICLVSLKICLKHSSQISPQESENIHPMGDLKMFSDPWGII